MLVTRPYTLRKKEFRKEVERKLNSSLEECLRLITLIRIANIAEKDVKRYWEEFLKSDEYEEYWDNRKFVGRDSFFVCVNMIQEMFVGYVEKKLKGEENGN